MLTNVMYVTLYVTDQDRAVRFYTEQLGLERRVDHSGPEGRFLTVGVPGSPLEFILWPHAAAAGQPAEAGRAPRPVRSSSSRTICGRTSRCCATAV